MGVVIWPSGHHPGTASGAAGWVAEGWSAGAAVVPAAPAAASVGAGTVFFL